ncbi:azurin [Pseudomonas sp. FP2300]|nr:azurin [Pseudomonas sp. FP2300]WLH65192.1 azurin [Pseudomonas sp. FP2300]
MSRFLLAALLAAASPAFAQQCEVTIGSTDQMTFLQNQISVSRSCKQFTVTLQHTGRMPAAPMGHNWVLSKTPDVQSITTQGIAAGSANSFLNTGDKRIIAQTRLIGGGESANVTFNVSELSPDENYTYFCSFPGHSVLMKGQLNLVE